MLKKGLMTLFVAMAALAMAATTELMVTAEVVHQENGYALKIGEELVPLKAYEMPLCLVNAEEPVKLVLKLEGDPPQVVAVAVAEGPCPAGTELPATAEERIAQRVQEGYLKAKGEVIREQNRWMLRIGDTEVPMDPETLPPCLRKDGAKVDVGAIEGDEEELLLIKGDCLARIELKAQLREQIRETLRAEAREREGSGAIEHEHPAMPPHEEMHQRAEEVKETVKEKAKEVKEKVEEVREKVEHAVPTPKVPGDHAH